MLSRDHPFDSLQMNLPKCAFHLFLWLMTVVTYQKTLNPMIFMTKDYFLERVHSEEMFIVQDLVEMVEDWMYCKRLQLRRRHEELKEDARKNLSKNKSNFESTMNQTLHKQQADFEYLIKELRDHVTVEVQRVIYEDPYGTKQIQSLNEFNPQILP